MQMKSGVSSSQLLRGVLVGDFIHGQFDDDLVAALDARINLPAHKPCSCRREEAHYNSRNSKSESPVVGRYSSPCAPA